MPGFLDKLSNQFALSFAIIASLLITVLLSLVTYQVSNRTDTLRSDLTNAFSSTYTKDSEEILKSNLQYINLRLFNPLYEFDITLLNEELRQIKEWIKPHSLEVTDLNGIVITDGTAENKRYGSLLTLPQDLEDNDLAIKTAHKKRIIFSKIGFENKQVGYLHIVLSSEKDDALVNQLHKSVDTEFTKFAKGLLVIALVGFLIISFLSWLLARKASKLLSNPLQEMTRAAEEFAEGNFEYKIPTVIAAQNEVSRLSNSLVKMGNDISKAKAHIQKQANYDHLTGLPNRFLSLDRLTVLINEAKRNQTIVAVMFFDLDDFKKVNDTLGHDVGDKLLVEASSRLTRVVRAGDTVGRLGGDEFIILLGNLTSVEEVQLISEKLLEQFRTPFQIDGRELLLTASIGIAFYPNDGNDHNTVLKHADTAMYRAKELGRNTFSFFTKELNDLISRRLLVEEQLHGALDRNEFEVFYQPKIDLNTENIIGAEALLRWKNPVLGQVSPDEFIPIAEQTGFIINLGQFVLLQAFSKTKQWQECHSPEFTISVNLSPLQFRASDLANFIKTHIIKNDLNTTSVELEITEGVLISGHANIEEALYELNDFGVRIVMDDFGTGYSSLSYLRNYPFHVLKIDKSFVSDINDDPSDRGLINAAISMAHSMNMKVVAEGIENVGQLEILKEMKCDFGQGYYFSRPIPANEFDKLFEDN